MDEEYFEIGDETAEMINSAERVVAVGTTRRGSSSPSPTNGGTSGRLRVPRGSHLPRLPVQASGGAAHELSPPEVVPVLLACASPAGS